MLVITLHTIFQVFQGSKHGGKTACWDDDGISGILLYHWLLYFMAVISSIIFVSYFISDDITTYQNKRGGRVLLQSMVMPFSEFDNAEKGDALYGIFFLICVHSIYTELLNLCSFYVGLLIFDECSFVLLFVNLDCFSY